MINSFREATIYALRIFSAIEKFDSSKKQCYKNEAGECGRDSCLFSVTCNNLQINISSIIIGLLSSM